MNRKEINNELRMYHVAGGHTRAAQAESILCQAGFRIERVPDGEEGYRAIYWPDGKRLVYDKNGSIDYREGEEISAKCEWPDFEAPQDFDDQPICRRPATKKITFNGAQKGILSCADCADRMSKESTDGSFTLVEVA